MVVTKRQKIFLLILSVICATAGYGIYLWHEHVVIAQQLEFFIDPTGLPIGEIKVCLANRAPKDRKICAEILDKLANQDKIRLLLLLAESQESSYRSFAVTQMSYLKEDPKIAYFLATLAEYDPDKEVRDNATEALKR